MAPVPVEFVELPSRGRVFRGRRRVHLGDVDAVGRLRLEALARFLQDIATDDADDARLSERRGVWVLRSSDVEVRALPVYHETVELATFCSGTGPRWAERRTQLLGDRGARIEVAALWVFVDRERGRPLPLDDDFHDRYGESAGGRRVRGRLVHGTPAPAARRATVAVARQRLRRAGPREQRRARSKRSKTSSMRASRDVCRAAPSIEYRGTIERGDTVELASEVQADDGRAPELSTWLSVGGEVRVSATVVVDDGAADPEN